MNLVRFLQRVPFWLVLILFALALGLIYAAYLVEIGGRVYLGDLLLLIGCVVYLVATPIFAAHATAALMRFMGMEE